MREEGRGRKKETEQNKRGCFFFKTERENHGFDLRSFFFFFLVNLFFCKLIWNGVEQGRKYY